MIRPGRASGAARQRRKPGPRSLGLPHAIVLGASRVSREVARALGARGIKTQHVSAPPEADAAVDELTRAVFVVPPIEGLAVAEYAEGFRAAHPWIPVFVTLGGAPAASTTRALYAQGVQAVFEWPQDKEPLLRTAFRLAGVGFELGDRAGAGADVALEELVNAHLRTAPVDLGDGLVARVRHRFAILSGTVDALWKAAVAEQTAARVTGVEDVVGDAVEVTGPTRSDAAIADAVRSLLEHAIDVDADTLGVEADGGRVTVRGVVRDAAERSRVRELAQQVRGVRAVESLVTRSPRDRDREQAIAARVHAALATHHPELTLEVAVYGAVVVLRGSVARAAERRALEALVAGQPGVERVVDKLRVRRPDA